MTQVRIKNQNLPSPLDIKDPAVRKWADNMNQVVTLLIRDLASTVDQDLRTTASVSFDALRAGASATYLDVESDGDMFWVGAGSGIPYGEIYGYNTNTTIAFSGTTITNKAQVTSFAANGESNLVTCDYTTDDMTIQKAGRYKISVSASIESAAGTGFQSGMGVFKNNGATFLENIHVHRDLAGGGGETGGVSMTGIASLSVGDTIEVWCWNETNTTSLIVDDITMNLIMVGG